MPLTKLALPLLALPRSAKRAVALAVDVSLIVLTVWIAFYLRLDERVRLSGEGLFQPMWAIASSWLIALPLFITHGFYRVIFRYSGTAAMQMVLRAFALYGLLYASVVTAIGLPGVPRSVGIIQPLLLLLAVGASRALARYWLGGLYQNIFQRMNLPEAVIYGAGQAGRQLAQAMAHGHEMRVVAFLDDDDRLHGHVLNGLPIHSPMDLQGLVETQDVRTVLLAMPIQAGAMAKGGDVFVLDMGQPVKIMDLARRMVELSGLTVKDEQHPEGDIEIAVTGLRPGEKLYEELLIGDNPKPTVHPRIMKAHEEFIPWAEFEAKLTVLEMALNVNDVGVIRLMMQQLVAGYIPSDDIVDWAYLEQEAESMAMAATNA